MKLIIAQILGIGAVIAFLLSYQMKKRRNIILTNAFSRILYIIQYILLGAFSGALLDILGTLSSPLASKKDTPFIKKHTAAVLIGVNVLIVGAGVWLAIQSRSLLDLLPIAGVLLHTSAFWITEEKTIRRVSLLGSPFWFIYNFLSRAYGSSVGDILSMVSIISAMIKFRDFSDTKRSKINV